MTSSTRLFVALVLATTGCSSKEQTPIADTTAGPYSLHIFREGPMPAAGVATTIVLKTTAGGQPTSVEGWVGLEDTADSAKTEGVFDSGDGDYDTDLTCPDPLPSGSQIWFDLTTAGTVVSVAVDIK